MRLVISLVFILLSIFKNESKAFCPKIKNSESINEHFQLTYQANDLSSNQKDLPKLNESIQRVDQLIKLNAEVLEKTSCYFVQTIDRNRVGVVVLVIKLQVLKIRQSLRTKQYNDVEIVLTQLKTNMENLLNKPSTISRNLGFSIRNLFIDELESLLSIKPELVDKLISKVNWSTDISNLINFEFQEMWNLITQQFSHSILSSERLARLFGQRSWKPFKKESTPLFKSEFLLKYKSGNSENGDSISGNSKIAESLEKQLLRLFKSNELFFNSRLSNFNITETESNIKHYYLLSSMEFQKNKYFSLKDWLAPVLFEKINQLKSDLGLAWSLIHPLTGFNVTGELSEVTFPIELLTSVDLEKAIKSYSKIINPIGRLYEIMMLKYLSQVWTSKDIMQLRRDHDRIISIKSLLAIQNYKKINKHWPASLQDLVSQKYLPELPKDYFFGKELKINEINNQVWSVGKNGIDENGKGDDIGAKIHNEKSI